ncbi:MAG: hypothetical protein HOH43_28635 [Candidatus Latescibacteria bacterium]|nr:hypothetical protein [Candidatus Latescibacterota bacterium]
MYLITRTWTAPQNRYIAIAALMVMLCSLPANSQNAPRNFRSGGTLTIGKVGVGTLVFHPLYLSLGVEKEIANLIYGHGLLRRDRSGELTAGLALMPTRNRDGKIWVFQLRPDISFHDGEPLKADDVVFTYNLYKDSRRYDPIFYRYFRNIERVEKHDPWTVAFVMKEPVAAFPEALTTLPIIPRYEMRQRAFAGVSSTPKPPRPIGLGPYTLESKQSHDSITLRANRGWHHGWPNLDRIVYKFFPTSDELMAAFVLHEVDIVEMDRTSSFRDMKRARPDAKLQAVDPIHKAFEAIFYNHGRPLFGDADVRRAMTHAIDRERILQQVIAPGSGSVMDGPVETKFWAYGGANHLKYDPQKAIELLQDSGWQDANDTGILGRGGRNFSFELLFPKGSLTSEKLVRVIKMNLNNIGVDVRPVPVELKELVQRMRLGAYDAALFSQPFESTPDDFYAVFHSESIALGFNMLRYENRQVDRNISFLYGITEPARALPIYQQLQLLLSRDQPCTFLFNFEREYIAYDPRFQNIGLPGSALNSPASWYILTDPR